MANIQVSSNINSLLIADSLPEYKAALNALGAAVWDFKGAYGIGTAYAVGDVVTYEGQTWYRIDAAGGNVGNTPSEGAFWTILAQSGAGTGAGDVVGPTTSAPNRVSTFIDNSGNAIQSSLVSISSTGAITAPSAASLIPFNWAGPSTNTNTTQFPAAATSHGAIVHSHADAAMYYAHTPTGGTASWIKMLDASVGSIKTVNNNSLLGNGDVTISASVADLSITTAKLANSSSTTTGVTTAKIADGAVTSAKLAAPTLFLTTAPVNGRLGVRITSVLKPDGTNIIPTTLMFLTGNPGENIWITDEYANNEGMEGYVLYKPSDDLWTLSYVLGYSPDYNWNGPGYGLNPADPSIVWTPAGYENGIPVFVVEQTSDATVGKIGQRLHSTIGNSVYRYECISETPYTWALDSSAILSPTAPSVLSIGTEWFNERNTQSLFYTGNRWIGTNYSAQIKKDSYTRMLATHMAAQVDSRLVGKDAANDMKLFTGLTNDQITGALTPNTTCWLNSLRSQLCGFHMGANNYGAGYGLLPLGGKFFLSVGHNGPNIGTARWPQSDGGTFNTTIQRIFFDNLTTGVSVLSGNPAYIVGGRRAYDLSIYITADPAPATLSIIPIITLDVNQELMNKLNPPTVYISQGGAGPQATAVGQPTPQNRKCAVMPLLGGVYYSSQNALRSTFGHSISVGDSGCPQYLLINNKLYLYKINMIGNAPIGDDNRPNYIQDLVNRAALAYGISPITITTVTNPALT